MRINGTFDDGTNFVTSTRDEGDPREWSIEKRSSLVGSEAILRLRQIHSNIVVSADDYGALATSDLALVDGDAISFALEIRHLMQPTVLTADCIPLALWSRRLGRFAIVHAGWKGLTSGVIEGAASSLGDASLQAIFGPFARSCCYEFGEEHARVLSDLIDVDMVAQGNGGIVTLDMYRGASEILKRIGVEVVGEEPPCTICNSDLYYSYRAGDTSLRMGSFLR
ncbi:MAG: polyphenol oxidase family protein [Actinomycetota bacterium]|nr:polyphenol oxidase family protein [Actinomycetota bacterium]